MNKGILLNRAKTIGECLLILLAFGIFVTFVVLLYMGNAVVEGIVGIALLMGLGFFVLWFIGQIGKIGQGVQEVHCCNCEDHPLHN